ncbi:TerB family tellurite resistance protein [Candidatus Pelagibacter bacterium]|jgi:uncharacterized tellurite resistance protein B-like protein|nr:TerB family tellurite resistance protein [Candidatus Pelagibacter bacterium]
MINFFKDGENEIISLSKIASLLIYVAKIDEEYTQEEEKIIKSTLIELGAQDSNLDKIMNDATIILENSNQILDFTKEVKHLSGSYKIKIIESLWKIIYSNKKADMYETSLMRKLGGLLYIDAKTMGDIKEKTKRELLK